MKASFNVLGRKNINKLPVASYPHSTRREIFCLPRYRAPHLTSLVGRSPLLNSVGSRSVSGIRFSIDSEIWALYGLGQKVCPTVVVQAVGL